MSLPNVSMTISLAPNTLDRNCEILPRTLYRSRYVELRKTVKSVVLRISRRVYELPKAFNSWGILAEPYFLKTWE